MAAGSSLMVWSETIVYLLFAVTSRWPELNGEELPYLLSDLYWS